MKRRYLAITLGIMLSVSSSLAACGTASASTMSASSSANAGENVDTSSQSSDQSSEDTVEGEVASVDGDTITVNIGTADSDDRIDQEMEGDILWDSISQLDFYMTGSSTLTGAITDDESNAGDGGDGYCNLYIENGSTWTVTGDSTLTNLYNAGTIVDEDGNTVSIVGTDGTTYIEGTSQYTITVDSYSTDVDLSGAAAADSWETYETAKPSELS